MTLPGGLRTIGVVDADRLLREDPARPVLLDVRERHEFVQVRAPGAFLVPMSALGARLSELPRDRPLLVICHTGNRSAAVTGYLVRTGRIDVANVGGGMDAWERAGLPVRRGPLEPGEGELTGS